jgi:putative membrane protein insertion efficiency factor
MSARRASRTLVSAPIVLYRKAISPALPRRCRYEPTCSSYALQAIERYGVARGLVLAAWRLLRCNPFSRGGFDPVDAQRLFKPACAEHVEGRHSAGAQHGRLAA